MIFLKVLDSKKLLSRKKNIFFRNNFSKNAQKSQLWRFYGVIWPDKWFFENEFSNKFWFPKQFFHQNLMRCKALDWSFDAMWLFNSNFDKKYFIFKYLRHCRKNWFTIWFFSKFSIQSIFFPKHRSQKQTF